MNSGHAPTTISDAMKGNEEALTAVIRPGAQDTELSEHGREHSRLHSKHLLDEGAGDKHTRT